MPATSRNAFFFMSLYPDHVHFDQGFFAANIHHLTTSGMGDGVADGGIVEARGFWHLFDGIHGHGGDMARQARHFRTFGGEAFGDILDKADDRHLRILQDKATPIHHQRDGRYSVCVHLAAQARRVMVKATQDFAIKRKLAVLDFSYDLMQARPKAHDLAVCWQ